MMCGLRWKIIGKKSTEYILYMLTHGFRTEILPHRSGPYICIGTMKESLMYDAYGNIYDCSETAYSTRYLGGPLHLGNIHNRGNKRKNSALATIPHMLLSGQIKQCKDCKYYPLCGGLCPLALYEKEPRYNQMVEPEFGMDRAYMIDQFIQERAKKLKTF